jgi:hypothetical protein
MRQSFRTFLLLTMICRLAGLTYGQQVREQLPTVSAFPKSSAECQRYDNELNSLMTRLTEEHEQCLKANESMPTNQNSYSDLKHVCSKSPCQSLHNYVYGDFKLDGQAKSKSCWASLGQLQQSQQQFTNAVDNAISALDAPTAAAPLNSQSDLRRYEQQGGHSPVIGDSAGSDHGAADAAATNIMNSAAAGDINDPLQAPLKADLDRRMAAAIDVAMAQGPEQNPQIPAFDSRSGGTEDAAWSDPVGGTQGYGSGTDASSQASGNPNLSADGTEGSEHAVDQEGAEKWKVGIEDLTMKGIANTGEVGQAVVGTVDNFHDWEKLQSSDPRSQIDGTIQIARDVNSQFNSNGMSKEVTGRSLDVIDAVYQKAFDNLDNAEHAFETGAPPENGWGDIQIPPGAIIPGYAKAQAIQQWFQNASSDVQQGAQNFRATITQGVANFRWRVQSFSNSLADASEDAQDPAGGLLGKLQQRVNNILSTPNPCSPFAASASCSQ